MKVKLSQVLEEIFFYWTENGSETVEQYYWDEFIDIQRGRIPDENRYLSMDDYFEWSFQSPVSPDKPGMWISRGTRGYS